MPTRPIVSGQFRDYDSADRAYSSLRNRGYSDDDIHVVMSDDTRKKYYDRDHVEIEEGSKALEGAGVGAATGGTIGGILGAIAAIGTNAIIPGLGLAVAGPLAGALAGAGAGGAAGSLVGALVGAGIPEEHAEIYKEGVKQGDIVVGVHPKDDRDRDHFANEFRNYGGTNVYGY